MKHDPQDHSESGQLALNAACQPLAAALAGLESLQRRFFPPDIAELCKPLVPLETAINDAFSLFENAEIPWGFSGAADTIKNAADLIRRTMVDILAAPESDFQQTVVQVMRSFRKVCRAQEMLYAVRHVSPVLDRFFMEEVADLPTETREAMPGSEFLTGLNHFGTEDDAYARGGISIYVPEYYNDRVSWPVVVALHGGSGHGRDFIWTWLREARSRGVILLAPSSRGRTWSILDPGVDGGALVRTVQFLGKHYRFDMDRILLTGISDGGTFSLLMSLAKDSPFAAFAPVAGVLAPMNINSTRGKRIYWVHGALDWMFPVKMARESCRMLSGVGADIVYREIGDLSHTYPREENGRILEWFDPNLTIVHS